ncbi:GDSL esterase/lipase At5g55050-like [Dioscorea cayenensis subsp. rotundata]|uniref:GDSL esterase/lipase At5g55050-like n=1 Tax=Dioscorea cayennensis subsp. rotundata TaxID=55577 RepID=A0AB40CK83_DIOCR|nr:GDSL esterase/lipase At5g55050-like [Dioscorea cayenensis subsp. rotundata]
MVCIICGFGQAPDQGMYLLRASIIDVGNNNFNFHRAKANYFAYGIDFTDSKATSRFSNGKNAADFLAEKLGLPSPKPYLSFINKADIDDELLKGVNYASGGAGILNSTYKGYCIPFDKQVNYFSEVVRVISRQIGPEKTEKHIGAKISLRIRRRRLQFDPEKYVSELINTLRQQFKDICNLGAHKFIIRSTGAQGRMPILRSKTETGACDEDANALAMLCNKKLASLMEELNSEYHNFCYSFFNMYNAYGGRN